MEFCRADYYSQTELTKMYKGKFSLKKIKELLQVHTIPLVIRPVEIGYIRGDNFNVNALYVLKTDWHKIAL